MRLLLDTNILIANMARGNRRVIELMARHRRSIFLSSIVLHEFYFGAFKSTQVDANLAAIDRLGLPVLAFDRDDARAAGRVRDTLRRTGEPIGPNDVLIAGQALARDLTLVTANTGEFSRVPGLRVENWLDS